MENVEKTFIKSNVEIGGEIFEQIEYKDYSDSRTRFGELMDAKFTLWDRITIPFLRLGHEVKDVYWKIRYGFQRMFKGYDFADTFDTFDKFISRYQKILTELKKNKCGYPMGMTEEEWDNILDEMIMHLYYMDEWNVIKELEKDVDDNWSCASVGVVMNRHKDEFFKLFSEHFYSLWD